MGGPGERLPGWDPGKVSRQGSLHALARLVRIEHTLFSLPFAYLGAILSGGNITLRDTILIGLAVLGLRTAAMAYNNIADLPIDTQNPRSRSRPLVTGAVTIRDAWLLVGIGSVAYYASAALLNRIALVLSPILWIVAMTYPWAKRIHWCPHIHLGLTLGLVVFGGAIAAVGDEVASIGEALARVPWSIVVSVTLWVAGFDIIYSIMDYEFDKSMGLGSVPARLGIRLALAAAAFCHAAAALTLIIAVAEYNLGPLGAATAIVAVAMLAYQHMLVKLRGLESIPRAFNVNLAYGVVVGIGLTLAALIGA